MKYRKKQTEIEAIQFKGDNVAEVKEFVGEQFICLSKRGSGTHYILATLEGVTEVMPKNYIIKLGKGDFYSCDPKTFKKEFESAE